MALTKSAGTLLASQAVAAATTVTGASVNLTAIYGGEYLWKITNGASAPTSVPTIEIQVSNDGTEWVRKHFISGDVAASSVNSLAIPFGVGVMYSRAIFVGGASNGSTMEVLLSEITGY